MSDPTRFPGGVSSASSGTFKDLPYLNTSDYVIFDEDFQRYAAGDWTVTETNASATEALTDGQGGLLLITNTATDDDRVTMQKVGESFKFVANKKTFFEVRFQTSDATQSDLLFGLAITDTTPLDATDGVFFKKDDGDANIDFASLKNSAGSTVTAATTIANATFVKLGFYFDGVNFYLYKDGVQVGFVSAATIPDDEEVTPTIHLQNGEAVAKTLTVDYIKAYQER